MTRNHRKSRLRVRKKKRKRNKKRRRKKSRHHLLRSLRECTADNKGIVHILQDKAYTAVSKFRKPRQRVLWEVYSMPRLSREAQRYDFIGKAFHIKSWWDLSIPQDHDILYHIFLKAKPNVLSLAVPCDAFSVMQNMSRGRIPESVS